MKMSDLRPLARALDACRKKRAFTQAQMADALMISRKTYVLFENCRWLPPVRERGHFVRSLYNLDPATAQAFVDVLGRTIEEYTLVRQPASAGNVPIDAKQAKLVFDAAVYATAEDLDMSPKAVRPIAATLLGRLAESGVTLAQAAGLAKAAEAARKKAAG